MRNGMKQGTWVLFDLDGTLTQSEEGICNSARYAAERMNLPVPDGDTLRKFIGPPLVWSFQEYLGLDPGHRRFTGNGTIPWACLKTVCIRASAMCCGC